MERTTMWNQKLATEFTRLNDKFMQEVTATGKPRSRFVSSFFLEWVEGKTSSKFVQAFSNQIQVWETASKRRMHGLVASLRDCNLCSLCNAYGRVTLQSKLCGNCVNTEDGQVYAQQQAVASVRKRWDEDYDELMEKQRATSREKYGTDYPWQSKHNKGFLEKKRTTCTERYGFAHPLMNSEVYLKQAKSAYRIKKITIEGVEFNCQGYEHHVLPKLVKRFGVRNVVSQFDPQFLPIVDENSFFAPDFYIKSRKTYVEVKSTWTLIADLKKNRLKAKLALLLGHNVVWLIAYGSKRTLKLPDDWHTWTKSRITSFLSK